MIEQNKVIARNAVIRKKRQSIMQSETRIMEIDRIMTRIHEIIYCSGGRRDRIDPGRDAGSAKKAIRVIETVQPNQGYTIPETASFLIRGMLFSFLIS